MIRILWLSRHKPLGSQRKELERLFGEILLFQDSKPFSSAGEVLKRFKEGGFDEIVTVAPLSVIAHLTEQGIKPLWAEMQQVPNNGSAEVVTKDRYYRFVCFKRIKSIKIEFEEIEKKKKVN
jgi:hypothetical protein